MPSGAQRWALVATLVMLFVSIMAPTGQAMPASNATVSVIVRTAGGSFAPVGVNVTLTVGATGESCTGTTSLGGVYTFVNGQKDVFGQTCWLFPGWFMVSVPAEVDRSSGSSIPIAVLPGGGSSSTFNATQSQLNSGYITYLSGLTALPMTYTLTGAINNTLGSNAGNTTSIQVLDPAFPGLVLAQQTAVSSYSFHNLPAGTWTVYAASTLYNGSTETNYSQVTVPAARNVFNITLASYLVQGFFIPQGQATFYNGTNLTLYDLTNSKAYNFPIPASQTNARNTFFQFGSYSGLTGNRAGPTHFALLVAPQGNSPAWTYFTVSPTQRTQDLSILTSPWAGSPPTTESTNLAFNASFANAWVNSTESLSAGSTIAQLPNAYVSDLYSQVGMDFAGGALNATPTAWHAFENWLNDSGAIYPAQQANLMVNATSYSEYGNQTGAVAFHDGPTPSDLTLSSASKFAFGTNESYQLAKGLTTKTSTHTLTMGFRYPMSTEALTYTVQLPTNWVLQANTPVPAGTSLAPAGPGGTWSSFTLSSLHSPNGATNGTATFNLVKIQNVTAVVNVNSPNFAFANKTNVVSPTHSNYTVIVGENQNVSFSSAGSLFPSGFNATSYTWDFGDGAFNTTYRLNTTTYHTYKTAGLMHGNLSVLANGGQRNQQSFEVLVDNVAPTPKITTNNTHVKSISANDSLLYVNWGTSIQMNATHSSDAIASSEPWLPSGRISVAIWNISAGPTYSSSYSSTNFSIGRQAASVYGNVTYTFNGAGAWLGSQTIDGTTYKVNGWVYRIALEEFDAGGNKGYSTLYVIVNDTEKPVPIGHPQGGSYFSPANQAGKNVTSGVAVANSCPINLVDKWSFDPHNGTVASYSWHVTNAGWSAFTPRWFNSSTANDTQTKLPVPQTASTVKSAAYNLTLNITDGAGNFANVTYQFTCQLNSTIAPILQLLNITVQGTSTLTEGQQYTLYGNVTDVGGVQSVANGTQVQFYYETTAGGSQKTIGYGSLYGFTGGVLNSSAESCNTQCNLHYNVSYRAEIKWTVPGGGITGGIASGQYKICGNATAANEYPGSYKTGANIGCTTVTINQSTLQQYLVAIIASAAVIAVLAIVFFVYRRRSKGGSKKPSSGKAKKAALDEDEDEEESSPKGGKSSRDEDDD